MWTTEYGPRAAAFNVGRDSRYNREGRKGRGRWVRGVWKVGGRGVEGEWEGRGR